LVCENDKLSNGKALDQHECRPSGG